MEFNSNQNWEDCYKSEEFESWRLDHDSIKNENSLSWMTWADNILLKYDAKCSDFSVIGISIDGKSIQIQ